jgi:hypothetical protein
MCILGMRRSGSSSIEGRCWRMLVYSSSLSILVCGLIWTSRERPVLVNTEPQLPYLWLKHFQGCTESQTVVYTVSLLWTALTVTALWKFREYCKERKIITLYMPPYSSHFLQPLDVGYFVLLKRAYSIEIENFIRCRVNHITKEDFLPAFKAAFTRVINEENIRGGFRGNGLVPFNPEAVISKLNVRLRTPSLPPPEPRAWQSRTPHNPIEIESQSQYVIQRIQRHQDSSPPSILGGLASLPKGVKMIAHGAWIIETEIDFALRMRFYRNENNAKRRLIEVSTLSQSLTASNARCSHLLQKALLLTVALRRSSDAADAAMSQVIGLRLAKCLK